MCDNNESHKDFNCQEYKQKLQKQDTFQLLEQLKANQNFQNQAIKSNLINSEFKDLYYNFFNKTSQKIYIQAYDDESTVKIRRQLLQQLKNSGFKIQDQKDQSKNSQKQAQTQKNNYQRTFNNAQSKNFFNQSQNQFQQNFAINLIKHTQNFQIIQIQCKLGKISKNIIIHNLNQESPFHQHQCECMGAMGTIYYYQLTQYHMPSFCIKCVKFNQKIGKSQGLLLVIKEYFINMIMSALKIGPQIIRPFGFNLLVFQNCVEFSLQKCTQVTFRQQKQISVFEETLKYKLFKMHALKIVHLDVKFENILFASNGQTLSDEQQNFQPVFIDFGLSRCIKQKVGHKSIVSNFCGTVGYCGKQMFDLFTKFSSSQALVDLYYNDIEGLNKTFIYSNNQLNNKARRHVPIEQNINPCQLSCYLFTLKYFLYQSSVQKLKQLLEFVDFHKVKNINKKLKEYIKFIPTSRKLALQFDIIFDLNLHFYYY